MAKVYHHKDLRRKGWW